ncbi:hypothetical protein PHMEG_00024743, partial [Phytophthora megakarya]
SEQIKVVEAFIPPLYNIADGGSSGNVSEILSPSYDGFISANYYY